MDLTSNMKNQIVMKMSPQEFFCTGTWPSEESWNQYLSNHYSNHTRFLMKDKDFLSYEETSECLMIKDFIATTRNAYQFVVEMIDKSFLLGKPIRGWMHISNFGLINAALKRFEFKIIGFANGQVLIERKG